MVLQNHVEPEQQPNTLYLPVPGASGSALLCGIVWLVGVQVSELCQTDIAGLPQSRGPPWTLHAEMAAVAADDFVTRWAPAPALGQQFLSCHSSNTGHASECGDTGVPPKAAPVEHSAPAPTEGMMSAPSYSCRKHSAGSSIHHPAVMSRVSGTGGHLPTGRFGSSAGDATAPTPYSPKPPASARTSTLMGGNSTLGAGLIPDVSTLLILRKEGGVSSATNSTAEGGRKDPMLHNAKQLHAAALDIDYGLASGLYARLMLNKWKWAEMLLVNVSGCCCVHHLLHFKW